MWRILKAEIAYSKLNFVGFMALIPALLIYAVLQSSTIPLVMAWVLVFLMINNWNAFRIKEKRDLQLAQLPIGARGLAMARMLMITIFPAAFLGIYALLHLLVVGPGTLNPRVLVTVFGTVVSLFSLVFMFRDRLLGTRALKRGKLLLVILVSAGVAANVYGLILARRAAVLRSHAPFFIQILTYVAKHNPSTSNLNVVTFLAISLALAGLTILSFTRRRTHLE